MHLQFDVLLIIGLFLVFIITAFPLLTIKWGYVYKPVRAYKNGEQE